ncbi:hypothetical protein [Streptomyces sp. ODS28]|uniref:hypothetical protein n=1 Tax=Streptomyces sp. ODS28 TaxID=3136688 RepID=UPI0031F05280
MTACAPEDPTGTPYAPSPAHPASTGAAAPAAHSAFSVAADGSYAARLAETRGEGSPGRFPERWTLDGPEPYAVPLPAAQPEEEDSRLLALADGRVLIARRTPQRYALALLYPTGPGTGELPLGAVESESLTLLPPAPCGRRAYALAPAPRTGSHPVTGVWLVAGSGSGRPEPVATVPGECEGGAWLDREGRMLALDRTDPDSGLTRTVVVDLARGGEISPLLQIGEASNDRLLLAEPDSGLLLVRSDAPGSERLGWGVLGSHRPVRFPEALSPAGARLTPFAVQPRQILVPESCAVALWDESASAADSGTGAGTGEGSDSSGASGTVPWLALWRPASRTLRHIAAPDGWLGGHGLITADGELRLPYVTPHTVCGLARMRVPDLEGPGRAAGRETPVRETGREPEPQGMPDSGGAGSGDAMPGPVSDSMSGPMSGPASEGPGAGSEASGSVPGNTSVADVTAVQQGGSAEGEREDDALADPCAPRRPVPLQQAPLTVRPG